MTIYRTILMCFLCCFPISIFANVYFENGQKALQEGNFDEAIANFEVGANEGSGSCCAKLATLYLMGEHTDITKSRYWANKGIALNSARCYGVMGLSHLYETDLETGNGMDRGLPYLIKAYELKDTDTDLLFFGNCGITVATTYLVAGDIQKGKYWIDRLVKDFQIYPSILGQASYFYLAINDYYLAVKYATKADKDGNIYSSYVLGYCFAYGKGVIQNEDLGFKYMKKAALAGLPDGSPEYMLGVFYEEGIGITPDHDKAIHWYRESAKRNNPNAINKLKSLN